MTDNTPLNADDELHDAIYDIAELNIKNIESCEMMYAVRPFRLIKFVKKYELQARIDELNRLISITRINGERVINQATYSLALDRIAELSGKKESRNA